MVTFNSPVPGSTVVPAYLRSHAERIDAADRAAWVEYIMAGDAYEAYTDGAYYTGDPSYRFRKACEAWYATASYAARSGRA